MQAIAPGWVPDTFSSRWANLVGKWSVDYFNQYKDAPGIQGITGLYEEWAPSVDKDVSDLVYRWLSSLDGDTGISSEYAIDLIGKIATRTSTKKLADQVQGALAKGKVDDAARLVEGWNRPRLGQQADGTFLLADESAIEQAWSSAVNTEPLIKYKGALGEFFGPMLARDSFVAILAPEKRGKSTWLLDMAWKGVLQHRKVAFFSIGDMSEPQVIKRLAIKAARKSTFPGTFQIPLTLRYENKEPVIECKPYPVTQGLTLTEAKQAILQHAGEDGTRLRLVTRPAGTVSAFDITAMVEQWADDGWVADIIVIDYADIMAGPPGCKELRDKINANWTQMRALSTQMRALVLTATQADTDGYSSWLLSQRNFSNDKRINAHVTGIVGINSTDHEKRLGITRLNWPTLREQEFMNQNPSSLVAVAGCMELGSPAILSTWI